MQLRFRTRSEHDIRRYIATGEPMDKAGAYAIQGRAAMFVSHISGSYTGIMGLPLCETATLLETFGYPLYGSRRGMSNPQWLGVRSPRSPQTVIAHFPLRLDT